MSVLGQRRKVMICSRHSATWQQLWIGGSSYKNGFLRWSILQLLALVHSFNRGFQLFHSGIRWVHIFAISSCALLLHLDVLLTAVSPLVIYLRASLPTLQSFERQHLAPAFKDSARLPPLDLFFRGQDNRPMAVITSAARCSLEEIQLLEDDLWGFRGHQSAKADMVLGIQLCQLTKDDLFQWRDPRMWIWGLIQQCLFPSERRTPE